MNHNMREKLAIIIAGIVYFILALTCLAISPHHNPIIWLSNSVLLIFIFRSPANMALPYCLVGLCANLLANQVMGAPPAASMNDVLANALEILVPVICTPRNPVKPLILNRVEDNTYALFFSIAAGCILSTLAISDIFSINYSWLMVKMLAMASILPLGLSITSERIKEHAGRSHLLGLISVMATEIFIFSVSNYHHELHFVIIMIPLLYTAFNLGILGNTLASFLVSSLFVYNLYNSNQLYTSTTSLNFFLMCLTLPPSLTVSLLFNQHMESQREIQKSERRWKYALESGNQGVWDWNLANNTIYFSNTWKNMFDFSGQAGEEPPSKWLSRIHPNDKIMLLNKLSEHINGSSDEFLCEHRMLCENETYKWVLARGKVITKNKEGKAYRIIGTHTDIDEIKKTEAEIKSLSNRLQLALDTGKIGIFDYNIVNDTLAWDQRMYEIYDVTENAFLHNFEGWKNFIYPEDLAKVEREFNQVLSSDKHFDLEFRTTHKAGKMRWIRVTALVIRDHQLNPVSMLGMNWDISEEKDLLQELQTEKERLSTTLHAIGDAVIVTNDEGVINFINPAAEHILAINSLQAIGRDLYDLCKITNEGSDESMENPIATCLKSKKHNPIKQEGILINKNGIRYYIHNSTAPIILPNGKSAGCIFVFQDNTINRHLQRELKHQATHDVLTGLLNRREMEHRIEVILNDARISKELHHLLFIDLDQFKHVNDSASHAAGDELLRRVASILNQSVRTTDYVARLGGDEFAVILPNCTTDKSIEIAKTIIEKIRDYTFYWQNANYNIDASIGITTFKAQADTLESILSHADVACYNAKNKGGGEYCIYEKNDKTITEQLTHNQILPHLKAALAEHNFQIYAQEIRPIINISQRPYHELLLRLMDDKGKLIPTSAIFKVADRQHSLVEIDRWVCRHVLINLEEALSKHPAMRLSINISSSAINSGSFHKTLTSILNKSKIDLTRIGFEMKEAAFLNDTLSCQEFIKLVLDHGCFISMDSFRKGLSAFQYLENIPELYIKIDKSFIQGMIHSKVDLAIVESINNVAHSLGAKTVAEFVESTEILNEVKKLGIDYAQGFLIAEATSLNDMIGIKAKGIHYES